MTAMGLAVAMALTASLESGCTPARSSPPMRQVPGGDPDRGRDALVAYGCGGCHAIPGVGEAESWVAPPLERYSERSFIAGILSNNADNLIAWIMHPQRLDPRTAMPELGVTEEDARDMAAYLYTLGGR
jgi:cytochrome c